MPPRSSSPICERSLDLTLIGIGRRDIPQCSSKHFHMEAFYRTFSGGQRPRATDDTFPYRKWVVGNGPTARKCNIVLVPRAATTIGCFQRGCRTSPAKTVHSTTIHLDGKHKKPAKSACS